MRLNEKCVAEYSTSSAPTDREGYLNKKGELNRGYQRRWFILKGNLLYYFEKRSDKEPIGVIVLDNCHVELAESGEPYAFQITFGGDGRTYILGADSSKEMEAWMRSITHSNYDYLRMMVESFESTLEKLTSDENDLASVSSYPDENLNRIANLNNNNATNIVRFADEKDIQNAYGRERTYPEHVEDFRVRSDESLANLLPQLSGAPSTGNDDSGVTFTDAEPAIRDLVSFNDESDDEQVSIPSEFRLDDTFFSFSKHTTDIMPLNYSDMGQLEHMHEQNLLGKLGGNVPSRSKDDSELNWTVRRDPLPRGLRPKSERRKNNVHSVYTEFKTVDRGKSKTLSRPSSDQEFMSSHLEHRSVFRHLHDLYSASICVKCKEFEGKVSTLL